jgi:hypothetical protein
VYRRGGGSRGAEWAFSFQTVLFLRVGTRRYIRRDVMWVERVKDVGLRFGNMYINPRETTIESIFSSTSSSRLPPHTGCKEKQNHQHPTSTKTAKLPVPPHCTQSQSKQLSTDSPTHDSQYKVRTTGNVFSLLYSYSMEEWLRTIDEHIHACNPKSDLHDTNSGYQYRISIDKNKSREVLISRDLELTEDYHTFLDRVWHGQVVIDPHDQCVSLEKV